MKIDYVANKASLVEEAEYNNEVRKRLVEYLSRTGMGHDDFSRRINYSAVTLRQFMSDRYSNVARSARTITAAILGYMANHPIGPVTQVTGDLYETENVRTIKDTFEKLLPRPVAYMLYAPPGSQKSFVLQHQVAELNRTELADAENGRRAYYVYARTGIRPRDLMRRIAMACGCRQTNNIDTMLANIRFEFRNRRVLLVIDEAQHLQIDCFETVRELLDCDPFFSLLFAGSHDLKRSFDSFSATLEQWNSRIIAKVRLPGLERSEALGIIDREVGFILSRLDHNAAATLADQLIQGATVKDAFEGNRTYINVRTLTNALDQIKAAAAEQSKPAPVAVIA